MPTTLSIYLFRAAPEAQPICGVMMQLGACNSGLSLAGGSVDNTSMPAPAILPSCNAVATSYSLSKGPRLVLIRNAEGFISAIKAALSMPAFGSVSGQCSETISLCRARVRKSTTGTSFSSRQCLQKIDGDHQGYLTEVEQLQEACWNGQLPQILPEICEASTGDNTLFLWEIKENKSSVEIILGQLPEQMEREYSIDPYAFLSVLN